MASLIDNDAKLLNYCNMENNAESINNSNNLKLSKLKLEADEAKTEISTEIENLIQALKSQKEHLLTDIDETVRNTENQVKQNEIQLTTLNERKLNISQNLDGFSTKLEILDKMESDIQKLSIQIPHLKIVCNRKLPHSLTSKPFVTLEKYTHSYYELDAPPKWSIGKINKNEIDFWKPSAIAVNSCNHEIYVADTAKILVFSQYGIFLRLLKHRKMMKYVSHLASDGGELLFATNNSIISIHRLVIINAKTGHVMDNPICPIVPFGLVYHDNSVYVGNATNNCTQILVFNSKLIQQNKFNLELPKTHTPSMFNYSSLLDFAITNNNELYGLFKTSENQIQIFDLKGHLIRFFSLASFQPVINSIGSILVNELSGIMYITLPNDIHHVLVISSEGKLVGQIGGKGDKPGCIHKPTGIALNGYGEIIVIDCKNEFNLQMF